MFVHQGNSGLIIILPLFYFLLSVPNTFYSEPLLVTLSYSLTKIIYENSADYIFFAFKPVTCFSLFPLPDFFLAPP